MHFHQIVPLADVDSPSGKPNPDGNAPRPVIGGARPKSWDGVHLRLGALIRFEQQWHFERLEAFDVAATLSLAPLEIAHLKITSTRRETLKSETTDSDEQSSTRERGGSESDILKITNSTSKTEGWNINGEGSVSVKDGANTYGAKVSGGFKKSVTRAASAAVNQIRSRTLKSTDVEKQLRKTVVTETGESVLEDSSTRTVTNPYRDRALLIKVFDLEKRFCVRLVQKSIEPVLLIELDCLDFDDDFISSNGHWIAEVLIDENLASEWSTALRDTGGGSGWDDRSTVIARLALDYLFQVPAIFGFGDPADDDPVRSFDASHGDAAFEDAMNNEFGFVFTALNVGFDIYRNMINPVAQQAYDPNFPPPAPAQLDTPRDQTSEEAREQVRRDRLTLELASSLFDYINPLWSGKEEIDADQIRKILDTKARTEAFRRISGFLALVAGAVKPVMQPSEDARDRWEADERLRRIRARLRVHLQMHCGFYTERLLSREASLPGAGGLRGLVEHILGESLEDDVRDLLDAGAFVLDGNVISVPASGSDVSLGSLATQLLSAEQRNRLPKEDLELSADDLAFEPGSVTTVRIPFDGTQVEVVAGKCILPDVPNPPDVSGSVIFAVRQPLPYR
ncbi:MAG: hypothetical protein GY725_01595 [bacterium]|nr:hypothetical protein [bacterium]